MKPSELPKLNTICFNEELTDIDDVIVCIEDVNFIESAWVGFDGLKAHSQAIIRKAIAAYRKEKATLVIPVQTNTENSYR